jgi:hypothetical protein
VMLAQVLESFVAKRSLIEKLSKMFRS